jgi:hypothetical protein
MLIMMVEAQANCAHSDLPRLLLRIMTRPEILYYEKRVPRVSKLDGSGHVTVQCTRVMQYDGMLCRRG